MPRFRTAAALALLLGAAPAGAAPVALTAGVTPKFVDTIGSGPVAVYDGQYYFRICESTTGCELWSSDGTPAGTAPVTDLNPGTGDALLQDELAVCNGLLFFVADDGTTGRELYRYDGTSADRVKDLNASGDASPANLFCSGDVLYFIGTEVQRDLYRTDGTEAGTALVADPGDTADSFSFGLSYARPQAFGGSLYFAALNPAGKLQVWKSDGLSKASGGTTVAVGAQEFGELHDFEPLGSHLYFSARALGAITSELWRTDGVSTTRVTQIGGVGSGTFDAEIRELKAFGNAVYFSACSQNDGGGGGADCELWKSDGVPAASGGSPVRVKDMYQNAGNPLGSSRPAEFTLFNGALYFAADRYAAPLSRDVRALWRSDGTDAGTFRLAVSNIAQLGNLAVGGERLLFALCTTIGVCVPAASNGSSASTAEFAVAPGTEGQLPGDFASDGSTVFFRQTDGNGIRHQPYAIGVDEVQAFATAPPRRGGGGGLALGASLALLGAGALRARRRRPTAPRTPG